MRTQTEFEKALEGDKSLLPTLEQAYEDGLVQGGQPGLGMNFYESLSQKTAYYPRIGENLPYAVLGLTGEAGEVANVVKKIQRDHHGVHTPEMREKVKDELGDVLWYVVAAAREIGESLNTIACHNIDKLRKRHGKFGGGGRK